MRLYCTYCGDPLFRIAIECAIDIGEQYPPHLHPDCEEAYEKWIARFRKEREDERKEKQ